MKLLGRHLGLGISIFFFFGVLSTTNAQAGSDSNSRYFDYPIPSIEHMLFYIQKSTNTNTVVYQLNLLDNEELNLSEPIKVFWLRYQEEGQRKNLSFIEQKFAYGVISKQIKNETNVFDVKLVALKSREFKLERNEDGQSKVVTIIDGKRASLSKIFLEIEGNSFWPKITYIDIYGLDLNTGKEIHERLFV